MIIGLLHFFLILFLGVTHHWSFLSSINDLGVYDQSLWGILHGSPFIITSQEIGRSISHLGIHFNPILAVFAPLYEIHAAAEWLILIQATAISAAAWPIYTTGTKILQSRHAALLWALVYLLNPFVINAMPWGFKPAALAAPIMALAFFAVEFKRAWLFLLSCFLLLLIREHLGFAVLGFGILWWLRQKTLLPSLLAMAMGSGGFALVFGVIMPAFSPTDSHLMLSEDFGQLSRYGWLGTTVGEVTGSLVLHPFSAISLVLGEMGGWRYLTLILLPLAFIPLVGFELLLPGLADFAANLLSANPMPRSVFSYHSIAVIPALVVAGMHGARRLSRFERYNVVGLGRLALFSTLLTAYFLAPLPLPGTANIWKPSHFRIRPDESVARIRALLPPEVSLSAQSNIAPHFTQRQMIRPFPSDLETINCVVLHLSSPTERIEGDDPGRIGSLAHHLQMAPEDYLSSVRDLVAAGSHSVAYWDLPWLVLCRGGQMTEAERALLNSALVDLGRAWWVPGFETALPRQRRANHVRP